MHDTSTCRVGVRPAVSAGDFDNGALFGRLDDMFNLGLCSELDELDSDSGLATSPESSSILSPDTILDEFIDCESATDLAFSESALQHGFGASSDCDGL